MSECEVWRRGPLPRYTGQLVTAVRLVRGDAMSSEPLGMRGRSRWRRLCVATATALVCTLAVSACSDRGSALAVVYRGNVSVYRPLIRVQLDSGAGAREMTAAFPSAARFVAVRTDGEMPFVVVLVTAAGDTVARYAAPPIRLRRQTSYQLNISIGAQRPRSDPCTGSWAGSQIAATPRLTPGVATGAESLFVSVSAFDRQAEPPRCDD